jgi:hypothetical protein
LIFISLDLFHIKQTFFLLGLIIIWYLLITIGTTIFLWLSIEIYNKLNDIMKNKSKLFFLLIFLIFPCILYPQSAALVSWNQNSEPDLAGYKVYHGTRSRCYSQNVNAGNVTQYRYGNLEKERWHFFTVTAYDTAGNESNYSEEVSIYFDEDQDTTIVINTHWGNYNYPNPFNPVMTNTIIRYVLDSDKYLSILIYDRDQNLVRFLLRNQFKIDGEHTEDKWDGKNDVGNIVSSGIYFCILISENWKQLIKIVVTK